MLSVGVLTTLVLETFSSRRTGKPIIGYRVPESLEKDARLDICDFKFSRLAIFDFAKAKPTRRSKHHLWLLHKLKQFALLASHALRSSTHQARLLISHGKVKNF